jgi:NADH:ubiquinone oxidoreductase subunit E
VQNRLGIQPGETTADREYTLETVACIGACALAPTLVMDGGTHGLMTPSKVNDLLAALESA